jgi:hypothetical protein
LQYLDVLSGDDFEYLHPKGIIPASAIIKVGEQKRPANQKSSNDKPKTEQEAEAEEEYKRESDDEDNLLQGDQADLEG